MQIHGSGSGAVSLATKDKQDVTCIVTCRLNREYSIDSKKRSLTNEL